MDYKYIEQLLERYWRCETSLQEEEILRMFFSQEDIPAALLPYRHLFAYAQSEKTEEVLGDDFDRKVLGRIEEEEPVKARVITMRQRFMPLFKVEKPQEGPSVAKADSVKGDTLQHKIQSPVSTLTK